MAETRRYSVGGHLDIEQILLEAQHRWLRPAEICEILQNYQKFQIAPEPANKPPSGSLFLFDRKVLRYFRKDGHNWRKKKDGKTVKEAHERLKAGSVDVLHCYYAHGEENENFQRRSYWLLEEEHSNIVLVHYLEVKNRTNVHRIREAEEVIPQSYGVDAVAGGDIESSFSSNFHQNSYQVRSQTTDTATSNSAQASEYEDAESAYNNQPIATTHPFTRLQQTEIENVNSGPTDPYYPVSYSNGYQGELPVIPGMDFLSAVNISKDDYIVGSTFENQRHLDIPYWEEVLKSYTSGSQSVHLQPSSMTEPNELLAQLLTNNIVKKLEPGSGPQVQDEWQAHLSKQPVQNSLVENGQCLKPDFDGNVEGKANYSPLKPFNNALVADGLKKIDSFNRWMSKELGDVDDLCTKSASRSYWDPVDGENGVVDSSISSHERESTFMLSPSLAQDQLFSIVDFSPNWAYSGSEIKVLITGRFLKSREEAECCKWSCMFGEVEVPAEIVADGVLCCHAPVHKAGRVPFYVTCSNRFACSEVREFEFHVSHFLDVNSTGENMGNTIEILKTRFANLLSMSSSWSANSELSKHLDESRLSIKISSLLKENDDEWDDLFSLVSGEEYSAEIMKEQLLTKLLKEKLHVWLIIKAGEGGKGASVLDEDGQGVLHFAAALGYDWALQPTIIAGVSVNFRDVNGWTALHWAASYGRERTVATLIALDAAPGALTDPTPEHPSGRTPADLASVNQHKGIAGYLAECALSSHLESINLDGKNSDIGSNVDKVVQSISERHPVSAGDGDLPSGLSLKDSLAAVCNATQAAARIHQIFRIQSFQRKQLKDLGVDKLDNSEACALSILAVRPHKQAQTDEPVHAAAVRIQNKFRGWKCRKEYLTTRQHIVRIQAHFRGHQVRKNYPKIVWSVGIVEKIILRWRRKGSGLRGFKREPLNGSSSMEDTSSKDDDEDFLKEGRKQTEVRLKKALDRVKSMVQYPEARDQYRRLLNVVNEIQETKAKRENAIDCSEDAQACTDDLIDIEDLFDEGMLMSIT